MELRKFQRYAILGSILTAVIVFATPARSQGGRVVICHVPPGNPGAAHTITVGGAGAVDAHLRNHVGDHVGACNSDTA